MISLYEDYYLLVCNKPPGLSTEIQKYNYPSLEQECMYYLQEKFPSRKSYYLRPVHRLDRAASGVVIFAKTYTALQNVNKQIENRSVIKKYIAIIEGVLIKKEGSLNHWLLKDNLQKKSIVVNPHTKNSKESILNYNVIGEIADKTIVNIKLETGRYHQIRSQFAHIGNPILNDTLYGGKKVADDSIIGLHAYAYSIAHPKSGEVLNLKAEVPINALWAEGYQNNILHRAF